MQIIFRLVVFALISLNLSFVFSSELKEEDVSLPPVMNTFGALTGESRAVVAIRMDANDGYGHAALFVMADGAFRKYHLRLGQHPKLKELEDLRADSLKEKCSAFLNRRKIETLEKKVSENPKHIETKLRVYLDELSETPEEMYAQTSLYDTVLDGFDMSDEQYTELKRRLALVIMKTNDEDTSMSRKDIESLSFRTEGFGARNCLTLIDWLFHGMTKEAPLGIPLFNSISYSGIPYFEAKLREFSGLKALPYRCKDVCVAAVCQLPKCYEESSACVKSVREKFRSKIETVSPLTVVVRTEPEVNFFKILGKGFEKLGQRTVRQLSCSSPPKRLEDRIGVAARSSVVYLRNKSDHILTLVHHGLHHGIWAKPPEREILGNSQVEWGSESCGLFTGTEGWAKYTCSHCETDVFFNWDNPFLGKNVYVSLLSKGTEHTLKREEYSGHNAIVRLTIE